MDVLLRDRSEQRTRMVGVKQVRLFAFLVCKDVEECTRPLCDSHLTMMRAASSMYDGIMRFKSTEEWAVQREERRVFSSNAPGVSHGVQPLDPIRVAGKSNLTGICELARLVPEAWGRLLPEYLTNGFPVIQGAAAHTASAAPRYGVIRPQYVENVRPLVWRKGSVDGTALLRMTSFIGPRGWVGYFQVPKTAIVDRAIVNCAETNEGFHEPPPLRLAEFAELLGIIKSYGPHAIILTSDIRHFFWQIRMPNGDCRYFSTAFDGQVYEWICLPMGWTWSPWVAQGVASLAVYGAVQILINAGEALTIVRGGGSPEAPAAFYHIHRTAADGSRGPRVASVVIWYDNFLVLTNEGAGWAAALRAAINTAMKKMKLEWKKLKDSKQAWCETVGAGEYVGIQFQWEDGIFQWRHVPENAAEWALASAAVGDDNRLQQVASAMGVLVHDSALRLARGHGPNIHGVMSKVGTAYASVLRSDWTTHELDLQPMQRDAMKECWRILVRNEWQSFEQWTKVAYVASDATTKESAMVLMESAPRQGIARPRDYPVATRGNFGETDINKIEALIAIKSILWAADMGELEPGTLIVAIVDNTTAVAWLNGRGSPDARVHAELVIMRAELARRGLGYVVMWVDTHEQPADEPSRNDPVSDAKVRFCLAHAKEWFNETFASAEAIHIAQSVLKRERE
jgi:hypothetical protein